jgi:hypothetical protein
MNFDIMKDDNKFKYTSLSNDEVKNTYQMIDRDKLLSYDDKCIELERLIYSRVYDVIGHYYILSFPDRPHFFVYKSKNGIARYVYNLVFQPSVDKRLPSIYIMSDNY